ncbi:hypothetical protein KAR34_06635 [bacterium]|nr:hypothetical protein [bacterium]
MLRVSKPLVAVLLSAGIAIIAGCAVLGDVIHKPDVLVQEINSQWITPEQWRLLAKMQVKNKNPLTLSFVRASYSICVNDQRVQTKVFTALPVVPPYSVKSFAIPLLLNLRDIQKYTSEEQNLRLRFSGRLFPTEKSNVSPLKFEYASTLFIPRLPKFVCKQIKPIKKTKGHVFLFETKNLNAYPVTIVKLKGYVTIKNKKFKLQPLDKPISIKPYADQKLAFISRELTRVAVKSDHHLSLFGEIELISQHGSMIVPLTQEMKY